MYMGLGHIITWSGLFITGSGSFITGFGSVDCNVCDEEMGQCSAWNDDFIMFKLKQLFSHPLLLVRQ